MEEKKVIVAEYYQWIASQGHWYGNLAWEASQDQGFAGRLANNYMLQIAENGGITISPEQRTEIMVELAKADIVLRRDNNGGVLAPETIYQYHIQVFRDVAGLPEIAWTGTIFERHFHTGSWLLGMGPDTQNGGVPTLADFAAFLDNIGEPQSDARADYVAFMGAMWNDGVIYETIKASPGDALDFTTVLYEFAADVWANDPTNVELKNLVAPLLRTAVTTLARDTADDFLDYFESDGTLKAGALSAVGLPVEFAETMMYLTLVDFTGELIGESGFDAEMLLREEIGRRFGAEAQERFYELLTPYFDLWKGSASGATSLFSGLQQLYQSLEKEAATLFSNVSNFADETLEGLGKFFDDLASLITGAGQNVFSDADEPLVVLGGGGADTIVGTAFDDVIRGSGGDDTVTAGDGADYLYGGDGNDQLFGGEGDDFIEGNDGRDILVGGNGWDVLNGGGGNDELYGEGGLDSLYGGEGDDYLDGGDEDDFLEAGAGNDVLVGGIGADVLDGGPGNDVLQGGEGVDTYTYRSGDQRDTIRDSDGLGSIVFDGVTLTGGIQVSGSAGAGGVYRSTDGVFSYLHDAATRSTLIWKTGQEGGGDWIWIDGSALPAGVTAPLGLTFTEASPVSYANTLLGDANPAAPDDTLTGTEANDEIYGLTGNDTLDGGAGTDLLDGGVGDDWLAGGDGDDWLLGSDGADILYGNAGADTLEGGAGRDLLRGDNSNAASDGYADTLLGGSEDDFLDGGAGSDFLEGGDGVDLVLGGAGVDYLTGGAGADVLHGDGTADSVTADWSISVVPGGNPLELTVVYNNIGGLMQDVPGGAPDVVYGGMGNDVITGGAGADSLFGEDDDDWIAGDAGDDLIDGGAGHDALYGDTPSNTAVAGDDVLYGGTGNDVLQGGLGSDALYGEDDNDELHGDDPALEAAGLGGDDYLDGGAGDDYLAGGVGQDVLTGGTGHDTLYGGMDNDMLYGGDGNDTLFGEGGDDALYGELGIDQLSGGEGNDLLDGGADNDVLQGGAGDDALYGGDGDDQLAGQDGNDALSGDAGADQLLGGMGMDVLSGGDGNDLLFGEADDDTLNGDAGDDDLVGGAGNDTLYGGADNDQLWGEDGNDVLNGEDGDDVLQGGAGDDALSGGTGHDTLYGQDGADTLEGGAGDDDLVGGAGNDTYLFNLGDGVDVIWEEGATAQDVLRFGPGISPADIGVAQRGSHLMLRHANGTDSVIVANWYAGAQYRLGQVVFDDGTVWTEGYLTDRGGYILLGTGGNDVINGDDRDQRLVGGAGDDWLAGGAGADTYVFAPGDGHDTVYDSASSGAGDEILINTLPATLDVERVGDDLLIAYDADSIRIAGWFYTGSFTANPSTQIETVTFSALLPGSLPLVQRYTASELTTLALTKNHAYTFAPGEGEKVITEWGGTDTLTFAEPIQPGEITARREQNDLILTHANGTDAVRITEWFNDARRQVEEIRFAADPATRWSAADLTAPLLTLTGTSGADSLTGGNLYGETLQGLGGADVLNGNGGDDVLIGGTGNDELYGGAGSDTYLFNAGDGQDRVHDESNGANVIRFTESVNGNDASLSIDDYQDLLISFSNGDQVRVVNWYGSIYKPSVYFTLAGTEAGEVLNGTNFVTYGGGLFGDIIYGYGGADTIYGNDGHDHLYGGGGNDVIIDGYGHDYLFGGGDDDTLGVAYGLYDDAPHNTGNEYDGGPGNDTIYGTLFKDTYYFEVGGGHDVIYDQPIYGNGQYHYSIDDTLRFGEGITPENVNVDKVNNDLVIQIGPNDSVTLYNWFYSGIYRVDYIKFATGTVWDSDDMVRQAFTQIGTEGDDELIGASGWGDSLYGLGGNDILRGNSGTNLLDGGAGDDVLYGGYDNDTYLFDRGYGRDTVIDEDGTDKVEFGEGISATDIAYTRQLNDLVLTIQDTGDQLVMRDFLSTPSARIEQFVFKDGSSLPASETMVTELITLSGSAADDMLVGTDGIDLIYGHEGNDVLRGNGYSDTLYGGAGNDTYVYDAGGGTDRIIDQEGENRIHYGSALGIDSVQLGVYWDGTNNRLDITGFAIEQGMSGAAVQWFEFAEGSYSLEEVLAQYAAGGHAINHTLYGTSAYPTIAVGTDYADVMTVDAHYTYSQPGQAYLYGNGGNDRLQGGSRNDSLYGGDGDDILIGYGGQDLLDGGAGNDTLYGGYEQYYSGSTYNGDDVYIFAPGYGADTIIDFGGNDTIRFTGGVARADVEIYTQNRGDDLVFRLKATGDTLTVQGWGTYTYRQIEQVVFGDGTVLSPADLTAQDVWGTTKAETLRGSRNADRLYGDAGNDTLLAKEGNDTLDGGTGNDLLDGGTGDDEYLFRAGWGADTIVENDATAGNTDTVYFGSSVLAQDLVFEQSGSDLLVRRVGSTDTITVQDWYQGTQYQTEVFSSGEGSTLANTQVDQLIQAMAAFGADHGGISWEQALALYPDESRAVLAAHWQAAA